MLSHDRCRWWDIVDNVCTKRRNRVYGERQPIQLPQGSHFMCELIGKLCICALSMYILHGVHGNSVCFVSTCLLGAGRRGTCFMSALTLWRDVFYIYL